ncbi:hypothetical protein SAMN05216215_10803 [Saccharopolyspora shandongensis]|uniref:Uncharacterized protein n=1 Tax=Saccharopolyspora shandongensis TaxID=418495 RepID=A0A1H3TDR6_9PSEU|nr:hypothetical protein [Saccharopolyspora shandongensis]SDZ48240.1 hypothetical protein SAMN05216215_10803 [Saccharopolyspora shandongensis]
MTVEQAQQLLDSWCAKRGDNGCAPADGKASVITVAAAEPLRPAPALPFPATLALTRVVSTQALVSFPRLTIQGRIDHQLPSKPVHKCCH